MSNKIKHLKEKYLREYRIMITCKKPFFKVLFNSYDHLLNFYATPADFKKMIRDLRDADIYVVDASMKPYHNWKNANLPAHRKRIKDK
jgi:hypothetical protein